MYNFDYKVVIQVMSMLAGASFCGNLLNYSCCVLGEAIYQSDWIGLGQNRLPFSCTVLGRVYRVRDIIGLRCFGVGCVWIG